VNDVPRGLKTTKSRLALFGLSLVSILASLPHHLLRVTPTNSSQELAIDEVSSYIKNRFDN
jgi:hypothetical protein